MLKPGVSSGEGDEALEFYANHTAQIEVVTHNPVTECESKCVSCALRQKLSQIVAVCGFRGLLRVDCESLSLQIVRQDRTMEEIVFPVPNICEFLTSESKLRVYYTTERDEQGSKINDFFMRAEDMYNEMNWQKKLRGKVQTEH